MTSERPDREWPVDEADWEALGRYLSGESPAAESEAVRRRLAEAPDAARLAAVLDRAVRSVAHAPSASVDVEAALRRVHARMANEQVRPIGPRLAALAGRRQDRRWFAMALPIAAGLLLVVGTTYVWRHRAAAAPARVYATAAGQRDSVRLADGSRVTLGPLSRLEVPEGDRAATLHGTALFDVVHDAARPFTVRAGAAVITDVGTSFVVRSETAESVTVAVISGSVQLSSMMAPATATLRAGDAAVLRDAVRIDTTRAAIADPGRWVSGKLVFDNATLAAVGAELKRWYGVTLVIPDSALASRHFTNTFDNDSLAHVLDVIALTLPATIQRSGDTVYVTARRPAR